jgi:hypothetical protein
MKKLWRFHYLPPSFLFYAGLFYSVLAEKLAVYIFLHTLAAKSDAPVLPALPVKQGLAFSAG